MEYWLLPRSVGLQQEPSLNFLITPCYNSILTSMSYFHINTVNTTSVVAEVYCIGFLIIVYVWSPYDVCSATWFIDVFFLIIFVVQKALHSVCNSLSSCVIPPFPLLGNSRCFLLTWKGVLFTPYRCILFFHQKIHIIYVFSLVWGKHTLVRQSGDFLEFSLLNINIITVNSVSTIWQM